MAPDRTISEDILHGKKQAKVRMILLVCANASGSDEFPLVIIDNALRPRRFKKRTCQQLGFDYWNNRKARMNSCLFFEWFKRFDTFIGITANRKVLLLIDNCSAHGTNETVPKLDHVELEFLPPNTTSKLQPMDAGIIATLETLYLKLQYERALDSLYDGEDTIYKIDQLTAMKYCKSVWENMQASIIKNSWQSTGIVGGFSDQDTDDAITNTNEERDVEQVVERLVAPSLRMSVQHLLNVDNGDFSKPMSLNGMAETVVSQFRQRSGEEVEDGDGCVGP